MEKINFVNGQSPYISATNLNNLQDNVENAINGIIESGSNSNGSYIKFSDGTMICRKTMSYTNIAINNAWGSLYESNSSLNIGNYAMPFINVPEISITPCNPIIIEKFGDATASSFGTFFAVKPKTAEKETFTINCIAIGKWK